MNLVQRIAGAARLLATGTFGIEYYPETKTLNAPRPCRMEAGGGGDREPGASCRVPLRPVQGLRRSEIEGLEWARIDDAIHLPTTESGREFWLPLVEIHHRILDEVRGLDERWAFPASSKSGHIVAWDHDQVSGTLHSLRHTFATVAVEAGIPEEVVGPLVDHASRTITGQRYVRPNLDFMRAAMKIATMSCPCVVNCLRPPKRLLSSASARTPLSTGASTAEDRQSFACRRVRCATGALI